MLNKQKLRVVILTLRHQNESFVVGHVSVQLRVTSAPKVGHYRLGNVITPLSILWLVLSVW